MRQRLENALLRRFERLHGKGEPHQAQLYRCVDCHRVITWNQIKAGDVCCGGKISPTQPKWYEAVRLLALP